jgi:histidinol-phosphatase
MIPESSWSTDLRLAHQLADIASAVSLSFFEKAFRRWSKVDGSLVTEADMAVERRLRERLALERPDDAVLGEEEGQTGTSVRRWIVDAIDGTVFFAAGAPDWATLIALECDGCIVVSVCDQPAHKRRYWASRGSGAFVTTIHSTRPRRLKVSESSDLSCARSFIPQPPSPADDWTRRVVSTLAAATKPSPHSEHPALQVATGGYEVAVFLNAGAWDLAAPALIVEEAGGRFSDVTGRPDLFAGTAVFSNSAVHDAVLQLTTRP